VSVSSQESLHCRGCGGRTFKNPLQRRLNSCFFQLVVECHKVGEGAVLYEVFQVAGVSTAPRAKGGE
jgi:hypothetical protein